MKYLFYFFCLIVFSCHQRNSARTETIPDSLAMTKVEAQPEFPKDTTLFDRKYTLFEKDSIYQFLWDDHIKVIYLHEDPIGKVHYKIYNKNHEVTTIAYTRDTIFVDPINYGYDRDSDCIYYLSDEVTGFYKNGTVRTKGYVSYIDDLHYLYAFYYWEVCEEYDENGILTSRTSPYPSGSMCNTYESFHPNGQRKELLLQGFIYASGGLEEATEWDAEGRLKKKLTMKYLFPEHGISHRDRLDIATLREYYPNGTLKRIRHEKSFVECDTYRCGEWISYNEKGEETHRVSYPDCDNFEMEGEGGVSSFSW